MITTIDQKEQPPSPLERRLRVDPLRDRARLGVLAEVSLLLASSDDHVTILQKLTEMVVPALGDWCTVHMVSTVGQLGDDGSRGRKHKRPGVTAEMELRSHFAGKRTATRRTLEFRLTMCGLLDNFPARTVDISRTGLLLQITDELFTHEDGGPRLLRLQGAAALRRGDRHPLRRAGLRGERERRPGHAPADRRQARLLLACRFGHPFTDGQCAAHGLPRSIRKRNPQP